MAEVNTAAIENSRWRLVKDVAAGLKHDRLLIRSVVDVPSHQLKELVEDLRQRTDISNPVGIEKNFVDGPWAASGPYDAGKTTSTDSTRHIHTGRWRNVRVEAFAKGNDRRSGNIVQVLAEGFIQAYSKLRTPVMVGSRDRLLAPHARIWQAEKETEEFKYKAIDPDFAEAIKDQIALENGVVETAVKILEDGSANIHYLQDVNTWVTTNKDGMTGPGSPTGPWVSPTEDLEIRDATSSQTGPSMGRTIRKTFTHITQDSVDTLLTDPVADWVTARDYKLADAVKNGGNIYVANVVHTAGATFNGDLAKWDLMAIVKLEGHDLLDKGGRLTMRLERVWDVDDPADLPSGKSNWQKFYERPFGLLTEVQTSWGAKGVVKWENITSSSLNYLLFTISDANLITAAGSPADANYIPITREFHITDDGTGIFIVAFERHEWLNTGPTWAEPEVQNQGGPGENTRMIGPGVPIDVAEARWQDLAGYATAWATTTGYVLDDLVVFSDNTFICISIHTSDGSDFLVDFDAGRWRHILSAGFTERQKGEALVWAMQRTGDVLAVETGNRPATGNQPAVKVKTWYQVPPFQRAAYKTIAEAYNDSGSLTHKGVTIVDYVNGYCDIRADAWTPWSNWSVWTADTSKVWHIYKHRYTEAGNIFLLNKISCIYREDTDRDNVIDWINSFINASGPAGAVVYPISSMSGWRKHGNGKYSATVCWDTEEQIVL